MDVHLRPTDRVLEGSTFLWFPWTVATLSDLTLDDGLTADMRKTADRFRDELLSRHEETIEGLDVALTYALSENLIGVEHALDVLSKQWVVLLVYPLPQVAAVPSGCVEISAMADHLTRIRGPVK